MASTSPPHEYIKSTEGRSPCPALNALANHGYLPRDGKNIGTMQLVSAITSVYNLSYPLAFGFATLAIALCGHGTTLDLEGLRKHDAVEHDASMFHRDLSETSEALPSNKPDNELIQAVIDLSDGTKITLENLIQHKFNRETQVGIPPRVMGQFLKTLSHGEPILCLHALQGADQTIPVDWFKTWVGEERLPEGLAPRETLGIMNVNVDRVTRRIEELRKNRRDA